MFTIVFSLFYSIRKGVHTQNSIRSEHTYLEACNVLREAEMYPVLSLSSFAVNARCSPGRILGSHTVDQGANFFADTPPTRLTLETHVQYRRNPVRCQFTTILGVNNPRGLLHPGQHVLNTTQNNLCRAVNRRRGRCVCRASN